MRALIYLFTILAARAARGGRALCMALVMALTAAVLAPCAEAKVGDVDPSYGVNGRFEPGSYGGTAVLAILNDGRVIYTVDGGYSRTDVNGVPDGSFGSGGVQAWPAGYPPSGEPWRRTGLGKWLVALSRPGTDGTEFALLRLGTDGTPDPTFGANGVAGVEVTPDGLRDPFLKVQPDGKPVLLLARRSPDNPYFYDHLVLMRLLQDGTPDAGFGTLGEVSVPTDLVDWMDGTDVDMISNGPLVVYSNPMYCFTDTGATTVCPRGVASDSAPRVGDLLPDGGWIAWRRTLYPEYALSKFLADGSLDLSFQYPPPFDPEDVTGELILPGYAIEGGNYLSGVYASADGRYVYAWMSHASAAIKLYRYFADGTHSGPDGSFGIDGVVDFSFSGATGRALGLADGSTMVAPGSFVYRLLGQDAPSPGVLGVGRPPAFNASSGVAILHVYRAAGSDGEVRVRYWMPGINELPAGGNYATPGVDFDAVSGELYWADGDTADKTIDIPLHDNSSAPGYRSIAVRFEILDGGTWIASDTMAVPVSYAAQQPAPQPSGGGGHHGGGGAAGWPFIVLLLLVEVVRQRRRLVEIIVSPLLLATSVVYAAPGDVDPTFAYAMPAVLEPDSTLESTKIDEDGRIVSSYGTNATISGPGLRRHGLDQPAARACRDASGPPDCAPPRAYCSYRIVRPMRLPSP